MSDEMYSSLYQVCLSQDQSRHSPFLTSPMWRCDLSPIRRSRGPSLPATRGHSRWTTGKRKIDWTSFWNSSCELTIISSFLLRNFHCNRLRFPTVAELCSKPRRNCHIQRLGFRLLTSRAFWSQIITTSTIQPPLDDTDDKPRRPTEAT